MPDFTNVIQQLEFAASDASMAGYKDAGLLPPLTTEPLPPATEWLRPGPEYIAPTPGFFFGQGGQVASLIDFLPSRLVADRLIKQYFIAVHPIAQILHWPTFEREYDTLLGRSLRGYGASGLCAGHRICCNVLRSSQLGTSLPSSATSAFLKVAWLTISDSEQRLLWDAPTF